MTKESIAITADRISLRQLRIFERVGRSQSLRMASEHCGLSQPAMTYSLSSLENIVGTTLLDRLPRGTQLNHFGEIFYARVTRFFEQIEGALAEIGPWAPPAARQATINRLTRPQIRALTATIEHVSFQGAAEALNISTSALHKSIQTLEANLGTSLLYRTAAGVIASPAGEKLGLSLKLAAQEIEWGIEEVQALQNDGASRLVIGAMNFGGSVLIASVLEDFLRLHPKADIRIVNGGAASMSRSLVEGDVDFVIGLLPELEDARLCSEALAQTPYLIVGRRGHPLIRKGLVTLKDVLDYAWVIGTPGSSRRTCFDTLFAGTEGPKASIVTCALPVVRRLIERSDRLTLMTSYELQHQNPELRAVRFAPLTTVPSIGISTRAGCKLTKMHSDFIDLIRSHMIDAELPSLIRQVG